VAANNLVAEISGQHPTSHYRHEMKVVIGEAGGESMYLHKDMWTDEPATMKQGRFWNWAKGVQKSYWQRSHS
jgi:hypothetical protein